MTLSELFSSPDRHTKGTYARNANGESTSIHSPKAVSWCFIGGLRKCYPNFNRGVVENALAGLFNTDPRSFLIEDWSDKSVFEDIQKAAATIDRVLQDEHTRLTNWQRRIINS